MNTSPPTMQLKPLAVYVAIGADEGQMFVAGSRSTSEMFVPDADPASRTQTAIRDTDRNISVRGFDMGSSLAQKEQSSTDISGA